MRRQIRGLLAIVAWIPISSALADTIHVPGDFTTIQEAIDAASDGDDVVVAPGTYPEAIDFLGKAIEVRGSDGREVTIIDATGLDTSVVTFVGGEGRDSVLDGFTITGGTGTVNGEFDHVDGGGVYIAVASPTIRNALFTGNTATDWGGGLASLQGGHPLVENCLFIDNHSDYAAGGLASRDGGLTLRDSTFVGNTARSGAGGLYAGHGFVDVRGCTLRDNRIPRWQGGGAVLADFAEGSSFSECVFEENWAPDGGGGAFYIDHRGDVSPVLKDCTFRGNESWTDGGALLVAGAEMGLLRCTFERNYADLNGAAIATDRAVVNVTDSAFHGNTARINGGAIYLQRDSDSMIVGSVFVGNSCRFWGGAVFNGGGVHELINSTFIENASTISGSGVYGRGSDSTIYNSIVRGSSPSPISQDITDIVVQFSNVEGGFDGEGNIDVEPMFVRDPDPGDDGEWGTDDDDYGDLGLLADSAGIDAGSNNAVPASVMFDLAGVARFVDDPASENTGEGRCPIIDIGAFEFQEEGGCCPDAPRWICDGDVDGDAQVNPVDAGLVQGAFGSGDETDLCRYDLDCDGQINPVDSGIVQSLFGACEPPRDVCP